MLKLQGTNAHLLVASSGEAFESDDLGNGALTWAILEGLRGSADLIDDGQITVGELSLWVQDSVRAFTSGKQWPRHIPGGTPFVIGIAPP